MEGVVERGTATRGADAGYTIAGKTGTAAKLVNGHYSTSDYNASFVGFVPSRNPVVAIIVVIDSPHGGPTTGGVGVGADLQAHRRGDAALSRRRRRSINPPPPVLVARRDEPARTRAGERRRAASRSSAWSPTARPARCPICAA